MKRRRHTPEQIIRKLREADRLLAEGQEVPAVAKHLEISEATYHRWRADVWASQCQARPRPGQHA
jgi:putative transposase